MSGQLLVNTEICTECRACELKCAFVHFGLFNSKKSGVLIVPQWPELPRARVCIQCEDPECLPACPTQALVQTAAGVVKVLYEVCDGCNMCVAACPYDGIWLDPLTDTAIKCDTCDGRFECVAYCYAGALSVGEKVETHV